MIQIYVFIIKSCIVTADDFFVEINDVLVWVSCNQIRYNMVGLIH